MPVIVIGGDTPPGREILDRLHEPGREIRSFVSDEGVAAELKQRGFKVALGDISDESHVEAASTRCFSAILISQAAEDDRERSFARNPGEVLESWARAVASAGVTRAIWVSEQPYPPTDTPEVATVTPGLQGFAQKVVELDDAQKI